MTYSIVIKNLDDLRDHPENYRIHPPGEIEHLVASITHHGVYKNIVLSNDDYILAGHGMREAMQSAGLTQAACIVLPYKHDSPLALKVLVGDNEIGNLSIKNDRKLTDILRGFIEGNDYDPETLLGTGFDQDSLSDLLFITRPAGEIDNKAQADRMAGLEPEEPEDDISLRIYFDTVEERMAFVESESFTTLKHGKHPTLWWKNETTKA